MRNYIQKNKSEPTVWEVEPIQVNPNYALVNRKQSTVSLSTHSCWEGTTIYKLEAATIVSNIPIPDLDGNNIPKLEDTIPQPVSSE